MTKLTLSVAVGEYDRTRALTDGSVSIDGVAPVVMNLSPEEIFFRAFRNAEFDICELSLSSFSVKTAAGSCPYVGVPAFLSRAFRHTAIYVRTDRIKVPSDLKGKRVGVAEYQLTANVWVRALLDDDFGVKPSDIRWVRGGLEEPGRLEKIPDQAPARCAARGRARGRHAFSDARRRRDRCLHRAARPLLLRARPPQCRLAVPRPDRRRVGLLRAHRHLSPSCTSLAFAAPWSTRTPWLPAAVLARRSSKPRPSPWRGSATHRRPKSRCRSSRSS